MKLELDNCAGLTQLARVHGWIDAQSSVTSLEVAGEGNMNSVLRAQLNDGNTLIFKQSLPHVAKYPDIPAPVQRLEVEAAFYNIISQHERLAARMPTVVGYDARARILCMQDLGHGRDFTHLYQAQTNKGQAPADAQALASLLDWLGDLHSLELSREQAQAFDNAAMRSLNHEHIFIIPLLDDNGLVLGDSLTDFARTLRQADAFTAAARALGDIYLGKAGHASRPCLLHGDYYPGSWIAHDTMGVMVIDPEFAFYGPPEFDVGVMLAHLTFAGLDQVEVNRTLRNYVQPTGFNVSLAQQFAGMEITRRLLGVAQLPLTAEDATKKQWLALARNLVVAA